MTSSETRPLCSPRTFSWWLYTPVIATVLGTGCWSRLPTVEPGQGSGSGDYGGSSANIGGAGGARSGRGGAGGQATATATNKLDLLLMIDNSPSMAPLQAKLVQQIPSMLNSLRDSMTGPYPDLHVGVVSSSMGAGDWANVNGCTAALHPGDDQAKFQQGPGGAGSGACPMLHMGQKFLANGDGTTASPANFEGDIGAAVQCMASLGDDGCGFESQLKVIAYALSKGNDPMDPDNGGFLRADARLAVILLTNEDDCSVADDSLLLDPSVNSAIDRTGLGALQSYRCNEFGHLCGGAPPPHGYDFATNTYNLATGTFRTASGPGTGGVILNDCVSEDGHGKTDPLVLNPTTGMSDPSMGHLFWTIPTLVAGMRGLKANPADVFVAAIAGPTTDVDGTSLYHVFAQGNPAAGNELDPVVDHSCVVADANGQTEYADPAVRIKQFVDGFGANGTFYPICASDYSAAGQGIAASIHTFLAR